jgi:hypothetical protein
MFVTANNLNQTKKIVYGAFFTEHTALTRRVKTGWLGIGIMMPSGATCLLPID